MRCPGFEQFINDSDVNGDGTRQSCRKTSNGRKKVRDLSPRIGSGRSTALAVNAQPVQAGRLALNTAMTSIEGQSTSFVIGRSNRYTIDQMRSYLHRLFIAGSRTLKSGKGLRVISATGLVM